MSVAGRDPCPGCGTRGVHYAGCPEAFREDRERMTQARREAVATFDELEAEPAGVRQVVPERGEVLHVPELSALERRRLEVLLGEIERLRGLIRVTVAAGAPIHYGHTRGVCGWCSAEGSDPHAASCPWPALEAEAERT